MGRNCNKNTIIKLLLENFNQIKSSFYKTNNKNITKNRENGNCELLKDNSFIRSKFKNLFNSYINSSNNIATFNCFTTSYNNKISKDFTKQKNQNDVVVTTPNNTTTADLQKKVFFQSNRKKRPAVVIKQYPENYLLRKLQ